MNRSKKRSIRFKVALIWACISALIVFLSGYILLTLVKVKRINDLATHSVRLSTQIAGLSPLRLYLLDQPGSPDKEEAEQYLRILLEGDPFIEELELIDQFGKIPFSIRMTQGELSVETNPAPISFPLQEFMENQKPSLNEISWEYRIPFSLESNIPWGIMKVRWRADATWIHFRFLKIGIVYVSLITFFLSFCLGYLLIRSTYDFEFGKLIQSLSMICGSDYVQRIDTQSYSKGIAEIGVHLNRILHDTEEEKKKSNILDQSLRQIERGCSDYRRALNERLTELDSMRKEMRESLVQLFDLLWCGILIIDDSYRIHFINDQAERLLRFARLDDTVLMDEKIRTCLAPLIRQGNVDAIDDLCVWPQPSLGQSVSCHIRSSRIPTGSGENLYFLLLREEGGYPKNHNSAYFSERLVLDYLVRDAGLENSMVEGTDWLGSETTHHENRFRACLHRLDTFHSLEKGEIGPVSSIRLTSWLRNHFHDEEILLPSILLDSNIPDLEISLHIPERILRELVDTVMFLVSRMVDSTKAIHPHRMILRASVDSRGKPMITLALPGMQKREASLIHELLNERISSKLSDDLVQDTLEDLEMEISYSLFRCVKQLLHAHVVCVFSEIKKLAMVRLTIENHTFQSTKLLSSDIALPENTPKVDLVQQFLSRY